MMTPVTIKTVELDKLLAAADVISVHIPKADKPIIGPSNLDKLKKGVLLINTARGGVFDEDTVLAGLASGRIGGAGLDVFTGEPTPRLDLLTHPAISVSPHVGGSTVEAQKNVGVELANYIIGHFNR
jgi:D-3-phosphoglycerate dehydrogenase